VVGGLAIYRQEWMMTLRCPLDDEVIGLGDAPHEWG